MWRDSGEPGDWRRPPGPGWWEGGVGSERYAVGFCGSDGEVKRMMANGVVGRSGLERGNYEELPVVARLGRIVL